MGTVKIENHPEYAGRAADYAYYRDHFEGGRDYANKSDKYIPKFSLESDDSYKNRKDRAVYINYCETVISIYQGAIWKRAPTRVLPDNLAELADDIDLLNTSADDFFQGVTEQAQAVGMHFVMVDAPVRVEGVTVGDAKKAKLRPYVVGIPAENVKAWSIEMKDPGRIGQFNFLVIEEDFYSGESPDKNMVKITQARVLYPDRWELYQKEGGGYTLIESGENSIGEVAVVPFYGRRRGFFDGESDLKEIAPLAQKIANWVSWLDEDMLYHAVRQLVIKTNADIDQIGIGSNRAIKLLPDEGEDAFILESTGAASSELWSSVVKLQDLIFRLATNQIASVKETAQVESAEKKKADYKELVSLLLKKSGSFERSERKVWELMARFAGSESADVGVSYHREFEITERTVEEWRLMIDAGILSVLDWFMAENQTVTDAEEAEKMLKANLQLRALVNDKVGLGDMLNGNSDGGGDE
jgi:hypothetical protein